jgi:hypothetical protein
MPKATYSKIIDFGSQINNQSNSPFNAANPITYCMFPTLGSQFMHGSSTSNLLYGNYNQACETFMAEHCAQNWDGFCDAYQKMNIDSYWPNSGVVDAYAFKFAQAFLKNNSPTVGQNLVRNAMNMKFLDYPYAKYSIAPFDPNTANSPNIKYYSNIDPGPSIIKHIKDIDANEDIKRMLDNATPCFDVIARLYLGFLRKEAHTDAYSKTILEQFFIQNKCILDNYLKQAIDILGSYRVNL